VYNSFQLAKKYLHYYLTASNSRGHGMHSPFVFDFIRKVLIDNRPYDAYSAVETLRGELLNNNEEIQVMDFGAGSAVDKTNRRKISSIAKNAAKPKKYGQFLYRMIQYYKPATILELGTSLGITTSYLSLANPDAKLVTMEGAPAIASVAKKNFEKLKLENVNIVEGNFDDSLAAVIDNIDSIDFAFLDGNHRMEPTIQYFNTIIKKINHYSIIVADDIHWSNGMEQAWKVIKDHDSVKCSIDLFFIGIIFFREEFREKLHFTIRF
jgi:predicted O-methyltransferase YrrM